MAPRLDIRWPIGVLWIAMGALLAGYGLAPHRGAARSYAIDAWWGGVMLAFGVGMVLGAHRGRRAPPRKARPTDRS